ncbi:hypothetical protein FB451DRAFT_1163903 [Mycena latifolia]|nr:hypothetical protein FB451DRAFT_1163903 [Mycena latifolia]
MWTMVASTRCGCNHWSHDICWLHPCPVDPSIIFGHNCLIGAVAVLWFMFATLIFGHNCLIGAVAVLWFMFAACQFHASLRTDYFAVNLPSLALHAPSHPNPTPRALPRLCQSVLSQFFPNAAMYLGELGSTGHLDQHCYQQLRQEYEEHRRIVELNARPKFLSCGPLRVHHVPQTNIQDPLPFLRPTSMSSTTLVF